MKQVWLPVTLREEEVEPPSGRREERRAGERFTCATATFSSSFQTRPG
jgi:hypothetical protein